MMLSLALLWLDKHDMTQHPIQMDNELVSTPSAFGNYSVGSASFSTLDLRIFTQVFFFG